VVNLGQPGVTSAEALRKLPELVAIKPQGVVIELGGHDFLKDPSLLKSASRASAKRNIERLIEAARGCNAEVVLIEVPRGFVIDPYAGLERQIAREQDATLIADTVIRRFVLSSPVAPPGMWLGGPYLSDDGLHPNGRGNVLLASAVFNSLKRLYGSAIRRAGTEAVDNR
jgi:lysophospholipase L1-like esterase